MKLRTALWIVGTALLGIAGWVVSQLLHIIFGGGI